MNLQRPSCAVAVALIATQVFGPAMLWAADQRGIQIEDARRVVIAAISGEQLTVQNGGDNKALHFRDAVNVGDKLTTGHDTRAEVLLGNRAVVMLDHDTAAQLIAMSDEQTTVQVSQGFVRVAAASSALGKQGMVTVQTPTGQVQTRGGIIRVLIETPVGVAVHRPIGEAQAYLASHSSNTTVAALTPGSATIQVEEGVAEVLVEGKAMTVPAGQAVTIQSGQAGAISKLVNQVGVRSGVLASAGHSQTSKEGRDHLVALQVAQAKALGNALTGAAETGDGKSDRKEDNKNVINGATGGVTLASNSLVSSLFGGGSAANPTSSNPTNTTGSGYGGSNSNGFVTAPVGQASVKANGGDALLVFTRKDPVEAFHPDGMSCNTISCVDPSNTDQALTTLTFKPLAPVTSQVTMAKELVLIGGASNNGHGGIAPTETLIVRGVKNVLNTAHITGPVAGLYPDVNPSWSAAFSLANTLPSALTAANGNFLVEDPNLRTISNTRVGGTLGQFSNLPNPSPDGIVFSEFENGTSNVDGAITATGSNVAIKGDATLDQGTKATISTTDATNNYYVGDATRKSTLQSFGAMFTGSLLSVIDGPTADNPTAVIVQGRLLGVYDGSIIDTKGGNKALLSVLDAKLTSPSSSIPLIEIAAGSHFTRNYVKDDNGNIVLMPDDKGNKNLTFKDDTTQGSTPDVTVTSALVTRSTTQLDGALLEASAPLFALTKAHMSTTSHFADLAGKQAHSLLLNDALVALNASQLTIQNGSLLNLNTATATVNGYLFSLNNGSTLTLNNGALFNVTNHSSLNLNGSAFGVFGSGVNTLSIDNNLCTATCFQLLNSANQPIVLPDGTPLKVAGATENVVLPNNFNIFALAPGVSAPNVKIDIDANDALFTVDGTSTLTINGATVVTP